MTATRAQPRRLVVVAAVAVLLLVLLGGGAYAVFGQSGGTNVAAGTSGAAGGTVDGIQCQGNETLVYHIHADLRLYDHGRRVALPASIGIPASNAINVQAADQTGMTQNSHQCVYWLHTHNFDSPAGVVHIESPTQKQYTLGQFLDIWRATSSADLLGGFANEFSVDASFPRALATAAPASISAYVGATPYHGSYRDIVLKPHELITVDLGTPAGAPLTHYTFPQGE